jgi:redox-sensitive bicupin YhaK (pirin superfamily)
MITIRKAEDRGQANFGWLKTYHTFSFANYYDRDYLGFRSLRVINEDRVQPGGGFPTHGHRDMEIITYVLNGALEHKDSLGNGSMIQPGEVQRMSAGTGILHSEYNPSETDAVHLLQIWLFPDTKNLEPSYEQKQFAIAQNPNQLHLVAAPQGKNNAVTIHQDVELYAGILQPGATITYNLSPQRHAWLQVAQGAISVNDNLLKAGDGVAIGNEEKLTISASEQAEILLFDLS